MSPVVSQSPININAREARWRKVRGIMGRRKEISFPLPPSHRPLFTSAVIVSRDHSLTAYAENNKRRLGRVSGQIKLEPHLGTVFLIREFLPREFTFLRLQLSTEIFSSSFLVKQNSFLLWRLLQLLCKACSLPHSIILDQGIKAINR